MKFGKPLEQALKGSVRCNPEITIWVYGLTLIATAITSTLVVFGNTEASVVWAKITLIGFVVSIIWLALGWLKEEDEKEEQRLARELLRLLKTPGWRNVEEFDVGKEKMPRVRVRWALTHKTPLRRQFVDQYKQHLNEN